MTVKSIEFTKCLLNWILKVRLDIIFGHNNILPDSVSASDKSRLIGSDNMTISRARLQINQCPLRISNKIGPLHKYV